MVAITHMSVTVPGAAQDSAMEVYGVFRDLQAGTAWRVSTNAWATYNQDAHEDFALNLTRQGAASTLYTATVPANAAFTATARRVAFVPQAKAVAGAPASPVDEVGTPLEFVIESTTIYEETDTRSILDAIAAIPGGGGGGGTSSAAYSEDEIVIQAGQKGGDRVDLPATTWLEVPLTAPVRIEYNGSVYVTKAAAGASLSVSDTVGMLYNQSDTPGRNPIRFEADAGQSAYIRAAGTGQTVNIWKA